MRELLFKGKRKDWREFPKEEWWVEGYIVKHGERWWIYTGEVSIVEGYTNEYGLPLTHAVKYEIEPETLCQYTGITDKNGKKIFESDIVISKRFLTDNESVYCQIVYRDSAFFIKEIIKFGVDCIFGEDNCFEVVGNIFDNPELLEVEE